MKGNVKAPRQSKQLLPLRLKMAIRQVAIKFFMNFTTTLRLKMAIRKAAIKFFMNFTTRFVISLNAREQ